MDLVADEQPRSGAEIAAQMAASCAGRGLRQDRSRRARPDRRRGGFIPGLIKAALERGLQAEASITQPPIRLSIFLTGWVVSFNLGIALIAVDLLRARRVPIWVPLLMFAFVVALPLATVAGRVGQTTSGCC